MTATFKVVEFYRNNNTNTTNNTNTLNKQINLINNELINDTNELGSANNKEGSPCADPLNILVNDSNLNLNKIPAGLVASFNLIYNTLGFNLIGGYMTDIPATIIDVAPNSKGKPIKVSDFYLVSSR